MTCRVIRLVIPLLMDCHWCAFPQSRPQSPEMSGQWPFNDLPFSVCFVQGKLVGICGSVGSGKTSLISAILGQVIILFVLSLFCFFLWNLSHKSLGKNELTSQRESGRAEAK